MNITQGVIEQLGGKEFLIMTGTKNIVYSDKENWVSMKLVKNKSKANYLKITLNSMDLYDVEFIALSERKVKGSEWQTETIRKVVSEHLGVYNDMLRDMFEDVTGLYTSLRARA